MLVDLCTPAMSNPMTSRHCKSCVTKSETSLNSKFLDGKPVEENMYVRSTDLDRMVSLSIIVVSSFHSTWLQWYRLMEIEDKMMELSASTQPKVVNILVMRSCAGKLRSRDVCFWSFLPLSALNCSAMHNILLWSLQCSEPCFTLFEQCVQCAVQCAVPDMEAESTLQFALIKIYNALHPILRSLTCFIHCWHGCTVMIVCIVQCTIALNTDVQCLPLWGGGRRVYHYYSVRGLPVKL